MITTQKEFIESFIDDMSGNDWVFDEIAKENLRGIEMWHRMNGIKMPGWYDKEDIMEEVRFKLWDIRNEMLKDGFVFENKEFFYKGHIREEPKKEAKKYSSFKTKVMEMRQSRMKSLAKAS